jgi:hypothetical protein
MNSTILSWKSGKNLLFKYLNSDKESKETIRMDIGAYFEVLKYIMMFATFVALVLIFLYMYFGREEKAS